MRSLVLEGLTLPTCQTFNSRKRRRVKAGTSVVWWSDMIGYCQDVDSIWLPLPEGWWSFRKVDVVMIHTGRSLRLHV